MILQMLARMEYLEEADRMKNNYRNQMKLSANNGITRTKEWAGNAKDRVLDMEISQHMEEVLMNRLRLLSIITAIFALFTLFIMANDLAYFVTAIIIGFLVMVLDIIVEHKGVSADEWGYPARRLSFRKIPIELLVLFFSCGVLITFVFNCFRTPIMETAFIASSGIAGLSILQIVLLSVGTFFMIQYFSRKCSNVVFGTLPISLALYLSYPEPWILVVSLLPMYIDYYLEKRLVKSAHIEYNQYDEDLALGVAFSYFPLTIFILGVVALVYSLIGW